jgi:glycosyltransferase involved in cell wall biosynthesis
MGGASASPFARRRLFTPPHHRLEGLALPVELLPMRLDLLHAPDMVLPWAWRGPTVVTVHDLAFLRRPELLTAESARYYAGVRRSLRVAGRIIAVSEHTRREILALCEVDPDRLRVIPNAIHPRYRQAGDPEADRRIAERYGLDGSFLLFVSTIEPRKNILTLLEAYRRVLDEGREIPLTLVGAEGWHSEPVHAAVRRLGLEGRARFLGFVPDEELAALYRRASLLAHPAVDEGFGLTPAEAMAAGTPVLVSRAGSLPEVVGQAGILLPPEDAAAWAAAIGRLLDDPALAADLAARGPVQVASLTRRSMARATLAVYREVLAEAAAGGMA